MIVNKYANGGGGSASGVTPQEVQAQIDSALTPYWESGETKDYVDEAVSGISLDGYYTSAETEEKIAEAVSGKADAKILVDFDHTTQAERAAIYAELKTLYDGGSGATINKNYDFYKTVNTWQGQKIDYYTFSGGTLVFGQVVSPENLEDQVAYVQVMEIDSAGNVTVQTNTIGAADMSGYYTSAQTDAAIAQAVSGLATEQYVQDALSGVNLDNYWTSAQTEEAISAATSGKADAANVTARNSNIPSDGPIYIPKWNEEGIIAGDGSSIYRQAFYVNGVAKTKIYKHNSQTIPPIYAPVSAGTAGDVLVSLGDGGAPVWSAVTMPDMSEYTPTSGFSTINGSAITAGGNIEIQGGGDMSGYWNSAETKTYVDSAVTGVQDQIDTMDEVVSQALVDLDGRVDAISAATQNMVISTDVRQIVKLTQSAYDQLATKDPETFYIIVNSN